MHVMLCLYHSVSGTTPRSIVHGSSVTPCCSLQILCVDHQGNCEQVWRILSSARHETSGHLQFLCMCTIDICRQNETINLSRNMRFPTMLYVRPAKPQIGLRIRAAWSALLLVAWIFYDCKATDWTLFGVSNLKSRQLRIVWFYICQNTTLLEIACHGSYMLWHRVWISNDTASF